MTADSCLHKNNYMKLNKQHEFAIRLLVEFTDSTV